MRLWTPAAAFWAWTLAFPSHARVVQWDIERRHLRQGLQRRSGNSTFEEVITNEKGKGGYFATVSVGTPRQDLVMQLDTASSDVWVPHRGATVCDDAAAKCTFGSFDPGDSRTFSEVAPGQFQIVYADQSYSHGDYFKDSFEIGGAVVHNLTMGLGRNTNIPYGLVGVGYATNEVAVQTLGEHYANLPVAMERDGLTNSVAYSLWLNDLDASKGNILFGGIDREKYVGSLKTIKVIPDDEDAKSYTHFRVAMTSLEATSPTGTDLLVSPDGPVNVVLDSGTTLSFLPNDVAQKVWDEVGASYQEAFGMAILPCSHGSHPGHFSFGFGGSGGPRINVAMDELVVDLTDGQQPQFTSGPYEGELVCEFGIQNYSSEPYILGDTFLRSAYVVYDLENHEIALAATDFNSTKTDIVEFKSKGDSIPFATAGPTVAAGGSTTSPIPTTTGLEAADGFQDGDNPDSSVSLSRQAQSALLWASALSVAAVVV